MSFRLERIPLKLFRHRGSKENHLDIQGLQKVFQNVIRSCRLGKADRGFLDLVQDYRRHTRPIEGLMKTEDLWKVF